MKYLLCLLLILPACACSSTHPNEDGAHKPQERVWLDCEDPECRVCIDGGNKPANMNKIHQIVLEEN